MNRRSLVIPLAIVALCTLPAMADEAPAQSGTTNAPVETATTNAPAESCSVCGDVAAYHPFTLSADAGITGFGGSVSWRFCDHLGLRAGADYFEYTQDNKEIEGINYNARLKTLSEPITLDIYPWKKHSFHISAGIALNQNKLTADGTPTGNITVGDNTYTPAQVGSLNLKIEQQPVNAYVTVGGNLVYFDRAHHWSLGGEIGIMYAGDARVSLSASGGGVSQADLDNEKNQIQDKANDLKILPVAKLTINFSF